MDDRATDVALFRYSLVRELATAALSKAERGRRARSLAARTHTGPGGTRITVSRGTIDRWVRALRAGGFEALKPPPRAANPKTPAEVLDLAERLRRERPERSAAHICVNGQFDVLAGGQLKVLTPRTAIRTFASCDHPLSGGPRACGTTRRR